MILAIDVHYKDNGTAKAVGVLFNWKDKEPRQIIEKYTNVVEDYISGQFYKRELPCIQLITDAIDLSKIECLIVDGHVFVDNNKAYGLGAYTWEALDKKTPIIGVAKRAFYKNEDTCIAVYRGESKQALFVSAIGMEKEIAAKNVQQMHGEYRFPSILKKLDQVTKSD